MTCICCSQGLHRGCQRWACDCPCQKRNWWDQATYHVWKAWDRLCEKALQAWEIRTVSGDPLAPVPSPPPLAVPAAAEPPSEPEDAPAPGVGREDPLAEYWRAKVEAFDLRHPSLLGPL